MRPASAAKEAPLPATSVGDAMLDAELAAARSDRTALLDLLSSKAIMLLHASMQQHRASLSNLAEALPREGEPVAATVNPLPPRPGRAQSAHAGSIGACSIRSGSGSGVAAGAGGSNRGSEPGCLGSTSAPAPAPVTSIASALLESTALLREMQMQASSREATQVAAAERASEVQAKYDCAQQDVTMLRNIVGELQAAGRLVRPRPATAGELGDS